MNWKVIEINGKWYIEVYTEEWGNIILFKDNNFTPVEFDNEEEARIYLRSLDTL